MKHFTRDNVFAPSLPAIMDELISSGACPPCLIVSPDATCRLGHSQYLNSTSLGDFQDYLADEVTSFIDQNYPTISSPAGRAVTGHSSGGFGALHLVFSRPDQFRICSASAADTYFEVSQVSLVNHALIEFADAGGPELFVKKFFEAPDPSGHGYSKQMAMMLLNMTACYLPDPWNETYGGKLFFDLQTGTLIPELWNKFLAHDPIHAIDRVKAPEVIRSLQLESGEADEYATKWGHRQLAEKARALKFEVELNEYPGKHSGHHWRIPHRIQWLLKTLSKRT